MYEYRARVLNVHDGDTLRMEIDLGMDIRTRMTVRLYGVDCPEINGIPGRMARDFTVQWITDNVSREGYVVLSTVKDRREKYGRYLGIVSAETIDPVKAALTLNDALIDAEHAKPYSGGKR